MDAKPRTIFPWILSSIPIPSTVTGSIASTTIRGGAGMLGHGRVGAAAPILGVAVPDSLTTPVLVSDTLVDGAIGIAYSETLAAVRGTSPYNFAVTAGALPDGLTLGASTGTISGTPTVSGTFSFTVSATDANALVGSQAYTILIGSGAGSSAKVTGWIG